MIPHYSVDVQECESCWKLINIDDEAILHEDGYFCEVECLKQHLYEMSNARYIYLMDDKSFRSVD